MTLVTLGPAKLDLAGIRAGDRNVIQLTITQAGAPFDLGEITVTAQARKTATAPDPPALVGEVTILSAPQGILNLRWDGEDVRDLLAGAASWAGVWDLQTLPVGGHPSTLVAGSFKAVMDVTR
jgi:hypothetical protein